MAAFFESGFFVREPAWHGMGKVADDYPENWDQAREWAGLEWEPTSAPMFGFVGTADDGSTVYDPAEAMVNPETGQPVGSFAKDDSKQRIVRSDSGALLGTPSDTYSIITHKEMGEIVEAVTEQENVKYETTVCLEEGKSVASLVRLDEPITIPGDSSPTYGVLVRPRQDLAQPAGGGPRGDPRPAHGDRGLRGVRHRVRQPAGHQEADRTVPGRVHPHAPR